MAAEISITGGSSIEFYNNYISFTVSLSDPVLEVVNVSYRTLRDTAIDYDLDNSFNSSANNGTLTFAPGETEKTILIEAETDSIDERDENIVVELFNPSPIVSFVGDVPMLRSTGIILDDDGAGSNLAIFVSDPILVEGDSGTKQAVFELLLSRPAPSGFSVAYETADVTAVSGEDYVAKSGFVTFGPDETTAYVSVDVLGDTDAELAETFALIVTPPTNPIIGTDGAVGEATILDTDTSALPEISITGDVVYEFYNNYLRFNVTLSEPALDTVTVNYRTLRDTAIDYDLDNAFNSGANNGTLTFTPGQTSQSILIEAESDSIDEFDENIILELFDPSNNAVFAGGSPVARSTGIILDDDGSGSNLAVFTSDPVVVEGDSGQQDAVFEVRLSRPSTNELTFSYTTADVSAISGEDYEARAGTLTFAPGQTLAAVRVPVLGDLDAEAVEKFALIVTPPNGVVVGTAGAVGEATLLDTDTSVLPELSIEGDVSYEFYNNYIRFVVTLSEPSLDAVSVSYRTLRDTAIDYDLDNAFNSSANNGLLTFSPGETTKSIFIEAEADSRDERDENVTLELFNPTANVVFAGGTPVLRATGILLDDDGLGSNLAVFVSDPFLVEPDNGQIEAVFTITLSRPAATELTMTYTTGDVTASAGEDYVATSGTVTFAPGQTEASVAVPVLGDLDGEAAETFALIVDPGTTLSVGTNGAVGEATILDTDTSPTAAEISIDGDVVWEFYNNYARFVLTLSEPQNDAVTVSYRTLRDTAVDYDLDELFSSNANNGTVTFQPGQTTVSVFIEAETDSLDERDENVTLELFRPTGNAVFAGGVPFLRSKAIILDDDGAGSNTAVHVSDPILIEGNSGQTEAVFEIILSSPSSIPVTMTYETADITAEAGQDYIPTSGSVTFAPGQTKQAVSVAVLGDNAGEAAEQFALNVTPGASPSVGTDGAVGVASVLDTDTTTLPEISVSGDVAVEFYNNFIRYVVNLSEPSNQVVTVAYEVIEGDAVAADLDNGLQSGVLTFSPGEITKSVFIEAETDTLDERDESIFLKLSSPTNAVLPREEASIYATGFILDNDGTGPNRAIAGAQTEVAETSLEFTDYFVDVTMSRPSSTALTFDASLVSLTGTIGPDISLQDTQVTFVPGATKAAVKVRVFADDDVTEGTETVELALTPANGTPFVGSISNTLITISDGPRFIIPGNQAEILFGTPGDDTINLFGGDDFYDGRAGDDTIQPGTGDDQVVGGLGNDTVDYSAASGGVSVYLEYTGRNVGGGEGRDNLVSIENLTGSAYADRLVGDSNNNVFIGGDGDDVVKGKGGDDMFYGGDGNDTLRGAEGVDNIYGEAGSDILLGLEGNDYLDGASGVDFLYGGQDSDILFGRSGGDTLRGNRGGDTLHGGGGGDDLRGGGNGDVINGDGGNDFILGEGGGDIISGGAGDDTLFGGFGGDTFDGQADVFIYADSASGNGGFDRIRDFENGTDKIDLSDFEFTDFTTDVLARASDSGSAMRINFGNGDVIYIDNFSRSEFDASDVIL